MGTVGGGTFNVLQRNGGEITRRTGREVIVEQVAQRRANTACNMGSTETTDDILP